MRIVQTFWSCNKNLLENNFGWLSPQYHLMAWTLSCLRLNEYYEDLHLYTDTNGYEILGRYLGLPYRSIQISYDSIGHYNEHLWALPKIMTYAAQEDPFIHVDGDVFIWEKFKPELEDAELIAQNFEIGTVYYKKMMQNIRKDIGNIPKFLDEDLDAESIPSYNMGILGGKDLDFFRRYSQVALELIHKNAHEKDRLSVNFNILFEQILFYSLSTKENKTITCYFEKVFKDNGYRTKDIADFSSVPYRLKYLHLIGAKKRSKEICELMSRTLFQEYPEYFLKITALFRKDHTHFSSKITSIFPGAAANNPSFPGTAITQAGPPVERSGPPALKESSEYEILLSGILGKWEGVSGKDLYSIECASNDYFEFFFLTKERQLNTVLTKNAFLEIIEPSSPPSIACIPELFFKGYNELIIDDLNYNILAILENPMPLKELLRELETCLPADDVKAGPTTLYDLTLIELKGLFHNKCIFIKKPDHE